MMAGLNIRLNRFKRFLNLWATRPSPRHLLVIFKLFICWQDTHLNLKIVVPEVRVRKTLNACILSYQFCHVIFTSLYQRRRICTAQCRLGVHTNSINKMPKHDKRSRNNNNISEFARCSIITQNNSDEMFIWIILALFIKHVSSYL